MIRKLIVATIATAISTASLAAEIGAQEFAQKAAQSDMFEMEAAKLVLEKSTSEKVKAFAADMVKDHHRSTTELQDAANKDGVQLPDDMGKDLEVKLAALRPLSGPTLDSAYVATQVSVHSEAVELFDAYAKDGEAGSLKRFAMATHPTIRMHLVRVRNFNVEN